MYLVEKFTKAEWLKQQVREVPGLRVTFDAPVEEAMETVEWHGSSFSDPGPDFNLYQAIGGDGKVL